jgi:hypothetical protein
MLGILIEYKRLIDLAFSLGLFGVAAWQVRTFVVTGQCSLPRTWLRQGGNPWWLLFSWIAFGFAGLLGAFRALS